MAQQKQAITLIRWQALGNNAVGVQLSGQNEWLKFTIETCTLRFVAMRELNADEMNQLTKFLQHRLNLSVSVTAPQERRPLVDRGVASRLFPETVQSMVLIQVELHLGNVDKAVMHWPTAADLYQYTNQLVTYADVEPRSLREVLDIDLWRTAVTVEHESMPCVAYTTYEKLKKLATNPHTAPVALLNCLMEHVEQRSSTTPLVPVLSIAVNEISYN